MADKTGIAVQEENPLLLRTLHGFLELHVLKNEGEHSHLLHEVHSEVSQFRNPEVAGGHLSSLAKRRKCIRWM